MGLVYKFVEILRNFNEREHLFLPRKPVPRYWSDPVANEIVRGTLAGDGAVEELVAGQDGIYAI